MSCRFIVLLILLAELSACNHPNDKKGKSFKTDSLAIRKSLSSAPVLSPVQAIDRMKIETGFAVKLVAAAPLISAPVAITFDEKGRIWADEMVNYMPDTAGTGEDKPTGRIVILEDTNSDGRMDKSKVFMDSIVLPRALCLVEKGILIAEPPNLWYVEINNDRPGKKTLVDDKYAAGGNAEHQANGLLRAMDNWIYSANSDKRYRKNGNRWLIEPTHARGQWGIAQDNYGRLFYNNNSQNLLGDYFLPRLGLVNVNQQSMACYDEVIVADNSVYPLRPTPGVNRGYMEGVLDDSLRLKNFTAACGPVLYRGDTFGKEYLLNAFVAEPSANLIKRNILHETGNYIQGKQAYAGKEFLSSSDERFRPVSLSNGPDGALYIVDMYRGIIQHKTYITDYLKNEIKSRNLSQPLNCGRIYKIIPKSKQETTTVSMPSNPENLVKLLEHPNGWVRDKAQQMIVDGRFKQLIPALRQNLKSMEKSLALIHSLWTLEGLNALQSQDIIPLLQQATWPLREQALTVLSSVIDKKTYKKYLPFIRQIINQDDSIAAPYIAFLTGHISRFNPVAGNQLLLQIVRKYPYNIFIADAAISSMQGKEQTFLKMVNTANSDTAMVIKKRLGKVLNDMANSKNKNNEVLRKEFPKGVALFETICQTCHGSDGNGINSLAPPLHKSEWVTGNKDKLAAIVLFGLTGPVQVNGKVYKAPEINGEMPGIGNNKEISDEAIAQLLSFIRNSWSNKSENVDSAEIDKIRRKFKGRQKSFTVEELNKLN